MSCGLEQERLRHGGTGSDEEALSPPGLTSRGRAGAVEQGPLLFHKSQSHGEAGVWEENYRKAVSSH